MTTKVKGRFTFKCFDKSGKLKFKNIAENPINAEGLNQIRDVRVTTGVLVFPLPFSKKRYASRRYRRQSITCSNFITAHILDAFEFFGKDISEKRMNKFLEDIK